jgi:hypothetical protein
VYLGTQVDAEGGMSGEVGRRISAANAAFWSLSKLWKNTRVSTQIKTKVYVAIVRSSLLYGAENWALTVMEKSMLEVADRNRLRWIAGIRWNDTVSNQELYKRLNVPKIDTFIMRRRWNWLGHILRMSPTRLPKHVLWWKGNVQAGARRSVGAPKKNWLQLVLKESWDKLPWNVLQIRKPQWKRWKDSEWLTVLSSLAIERKRWSLVVSSLISTFV